MPIRRISGTTRGIPPVDVLWGHRQANPPWWSAASRPGTGHGKKSQSLRLFPKLLLSKSSQSKIVTCYYDVVRSLKAQWRGTAKGAAHLSQTWKTALHQKQIKTKPWKKHEESHSNSEFVQWNPQVFSPATPLSLKEDSFFQLSQATIAFFVIQIAKRNQEVGPFCSCGGGRLFAAFPADGFPLSQRLETLPEFRILLCQPICLAVVCLSFYHLLQHLMSNATVVICHR